MHSDSLDSWRHDHVFLGEHHARNEGRSWAVVILCASLMAAEIVGGLLWGSMALVADGLHMSTHAGALVIAALPMPILAAMRTMNALPSAPASLVIWLLSRVRSCWL